MRRALPALVVVLALAAAMPATSGARDPGRWVLTGASSVPNDYWQGLTSNPRESAVYFSGVFQGLWRTTPNLRRTVGVPDGVPAAVESTEGYNHIGDSTWNKGDGGRVILPLECYIPGQGNTCGTGAFGVADPRTLAWRYYVKLDPAEIPKAMWAESSPDGRLIWTSSGDDLLAYRTSDVTAANAAPGAPSIRAVRKLTGAVPPTGITGAVFVRGRLLLAGSQDHNYKVWAVDTKSGARRLELERQMCGESEGLDTIPTLGGDLHYLLSPADDCKLTYGPTSALLHFVRRPGSARLRVKVVHLAASAVPGPVAAFVRVTRRGVPVRGARVSFAGGGARTNKRGRATVRTRLVLPGRFKALARAGRSYGLSRLVSVGLD